jgi:diguanylate cyclase (GGDEF)-like protein
VVAVIGGLCWPRWAVGVLTIVTVASSWLVRMRGHGPVPMEWVELAALGVTPWLLAAQRVRYERRLRRLQAREAMRLTHLQEKHRSLASLQSDNQRLESQVVQITDLYHVTKETAKAVRVEELFGYVADIIPRLLTIEGLRLIDVGEPGEAQTPVVYRAARGTDGRLAVSPAGAPTPEEQAMLSKAAESPAAGASLDASVAGGGGHAVAWAPLRSEQRAIGVLVADGLPEAQLGILTIVANQVALQLARVHFYERIETMAVTDSLTGVFVRRYFQDLAAEELARSARHKLPCAFIMVDLDLFKRVNDSHGHLVGDTVLREAARMVRQNLREIDLMARYGGEEFIILLVETGPEQAQLIAERLRQVMEIASIRAYDEAIRQTVSVGLACYPEDGQALDDLVRRADEALYAAKRAGRNRVVRWTPPARAVEPGAKRRGA